MKKGFTLIEIIICVVLISVIGICAVWGVRIIHDNLNQNKLKKLTNTVYNAVNVYLDNNVINKKLLYEEKNIIVTPLKVLENEGLMTFHDVDIANKFVITLLGDENASEACTGVSNIATWELEDDKNLYFCTDIDLQNIKDMIENEISDYGSTIINPIIESISDLTTRIESLEQQGFSNNIKSDLIGNDGYLAKGNDPNNYLKINYNNKESLWRIKSINDKGEIAIIGYQDQLLITLDTYSRSRILAENYLNNYLSGISDYIDITKIKSNQYYYYNGTTGTGGSSISDIERYTSKLGLINRDDIQKSFDTDGSYLFDYLADKQLAHIWLKRNVDDAKIFYPSNTNGDLWKAESTKITPLLILNVCFDISSGSGKIENPYILDYSKC